MLVEENSKLAVFHNGAFPVEYRIVQLNGVKLFYREAGSKDSFTAFLRLPVDDPKLLANYRSLVMGESKTAA